jgi:hypothetical protein
MILFTFAKKMVKNLSLLYVSGRPIDSKNLFWPLHQGFKQSNIKVQETVWSLYSKLFPDLNEKDLVFDGTDVQTLYASPDDSLKEEFYKLIKNFHPSGVVVPQDQPGIYQHIIDFSKELSIPSIVLNEGPLTLVQTGVDTIVRAEERVDPFIIESGNLDFRYCIYTIGHTVKVLPRWGYRKFRGLSSVRRSTDNNRIRYRGQSGADLILVLGDYDYRNLIRLGVKKDTILRVGWLRSDVLFNNHQLSRKELLNTLNFKQNDRYVLLISQSFEYSQVPTRYNDFIELMNVASTFLKFQPNLKFVLTIHPSVELDNVRKHINKHPVSKRVKLLKGFTDTLALNKNAEAVVGFYSTALFDAMVTERPIITLDYVPMQLYYPFNVEYGAVIPVFHKFELENQIRRLYEDKTYVRRVIENQKGLLSDVLGNPKGGVKFKVVEAILKLLN